MVDGVIKLSSRTGSFISQSELETVWIFKGAW
jgi:hypothetical protein